MLRLAYRARRLWSIPNPLRHLTCLERKEIHDYSSSYDDDESNRDDINQQRINLAKTIRLISTEQDVSCNEWIEQWINRISIDHVSSGESLLTRKKFFLLNEQWLEIWVFLDDDFQFTNELIDAQSCENLDPDKFMEDKEIRVSDLYLFSSI